MTGFIFFNNSFFFGVLVREFFPKRHSLQSQLCFFLHLIACKNIRLSEQTGMIFINRAIFTYNWSKNFRNLFQNRTRITDSLSEHQSKFLSVFRVIRSISSTMNKSLEYGRNQRRNKLFVSSEIFNNRQGFRDERRKQKEGKTVPGLFVTCSFFFSISPVFKNT